MLVLPLSACGAATGETASLAMERTATGADAEYIQELIDLDDAWAEQSDADIVETGEAFCAILDGTTSPAKAMGALYGAIPAGKADSFAIITVSNYCSHQLYSVTSYLGYK